MAKKRDQIVKIIQACEILYGANLINYSVISNRIHLLAQMWSEANREPLTQKSLVLMLLVFSIPAAMSIV